MDVHICETTSRFNFGFTVSINEEVKKYNTTEKIQKKIKAVPNKMV